MSRMISLLLILTLNLVDSDFSHVLSAQINTHHINAITDYPDSGAQDLPDLEVRGAAVSSRKRDSDGKIKLNVSETLKLTRTFGEADLIAGLKSIAWVESGSDYGSGISVKGAVPSQTQYLVDGVPVIFPFRFGGVFSTFNSSHFSALTFQSISPAGLSPRLGGAVALESARRFKDGMEGIANVGIISSSVSVKAGFREKLAFSLAGRISYIDQIYGKLLKSDRSTIGYSFNDLNASLAWRISKNDRLGVTFLRSTDNVGYDDDNYNMLTRLKWENTCGGLSFHHSGDFNVNTNIWLSHFSDRLGMSMPQFVLTAPSSLMSGGGRISFSGKIQKGFFQEWEAGFFSEIFRAVPQWAILQMSDELSGYADRYSEKMPQKMFSGLAFGRVAMCPMENFRMEFSLAAGLFRSRKYQEKWWSRPLLSPRIQLFWTAGKYGDFLFGAGWLEQYLHQIGFSELGLASDFTVGANSKAPIQKSLSFDLTWVHRLPWGLKFSVNGYWSLVHDQSEYQGQVLEVVDENYDPFMHIIVSEGYNVGVNATISREFGALNGDISYGYAAGRRHFPAGDDSWNAINSPGHSFKASVAWHLNGRWIISAGYIFTSGRVYTPVDALYLVSGNIAMEYGARNSARLPYYSRLDLGATYTVSSSSRIKHLLNISLLNALGRRNVEMQYFLLKPQNNTYGMKRLYSLYRFLPSLSYTIEFK